MTPSTVFLDRDGTINVKAPEGEYVSSPEQLRLLPGAAAGVAALNAAGVRTVLITNQRGVARGVMTSDDVEATHAHLQALLAREGAHLDAVYYCPHAASSCVCRKPDTGMVLQAVQDHPEIDLRRAALIGDADSDVALGETLGLLTYRIGGRQEHDGVATRVANSLQAAVGELLAPDA